NAILCAKDHLNRVGDGTNSVTLEHCSHPIPTRTPTRPMDCLEKRKVAPLPALSRLEPKDRPVQRRREEIAHPGVGWYLSGFVLNKQIDVAKEASAAVQFQRHWPRVLELNLAGEGAWRAQTAEAADQLPVRINHGVLPANDQVQRRWGPRRR